MTTVNTEYEEAQPHLWKDTTGQWWIYFTATDNIDTGTVGIFRARQGTANNWDSWTGRELVIGAGNAYAVGEPTLTQWGDISFVVAYQAPDGTPTDKYDADPWFLPKKGSPAAGAGQ